jgi:hypothetical protein
MLCVSFSDRGSEFDRLIWMGIIIDNYLPFYKGKMAMRAIVIISLLMSAVYFTACGSNRLVTIDSRPQGADVIADGKKIGVTPIEILPDDVFPPRWIGTSYMVKGKLELIKPDCEPLNMEVNDYVLSQPVIKDLKCTRASKIVPAVAAEPGSSSAKTSKNDIEQRLEELQGLHDKGLISDQEYQTQRQRILSEL